jgi:hypothetical protein
MGLFKILLGPLGLGLPLRPTTGRERSRRYQRQSNRLLEELVDQDFYGGPPASSDTRTRMECPACREYVVVGASICAFCSFPIAEVALAQQLQAAREQGKIRHEEDMQEKVSARTAEDSYRTRLFEQSQAKRQKENAARKALEIQQATEKLGTEVVQCPFCSLYIAAESTSCPHCDNNL